MIGLQFVNEKTGEFQNFYCSKPKVVQTFTKYLLKKINHLGFHHLFKPMKKLGKGNFATVFQVARISDRKVFAVKAFSKAILNADEKGK